MNKKRLKIFFKIFLLVGIIALAIISGSNHKEKAQSEYIVFNGSSINGKIESISISNGFSFISVEGDDRKYMFYPLHGDNEKGFSSVASVGDHFIKNDGDKYFTLITESMEYKYPFKAIVN